jgi:ribosomal protein L40E
VAIAGSFTLLFRLGQPATCMHTVQYVWRLIVPRRWPAKFEPLRRPGPRIWLSRSIAFSTLRTCHPLVTAPFPRHTVMGYDAGDFFPLFARHAAIHARASATFAGALPFADAGAPDVAALAAAARTDSAARSAMPSAESTSRTVSARRRRSAPASPAAILSSSSRLMSVNVCARSSAKNRRRARNCRAKTTPTTCARAVTSGQIGWLPGWRARVSRCPSFRSGSYGISAQHVSCILGSTMPDARGRSDLVLLR